MWIYDPEKKTVLALSAIPSALEKGSWSLALPKKLCDIMYCKVRVCKQLRRASQRQVSVSPGPTSWQHLWVKGVAAGGRSVSLDLHLQVLQTTVMDLWFMRVQRLFLILKKPQGVEENRK